MEKHIRALFRPCSHIPRFLQFVLVVTWFCLDQAAAKRDSRKAVRFVRNSIEQFLTGEKLWINFIRLQLNKSSLLFESFHNFILE